MRHRAFVLQAGDTLGTGQRQQCHPPGGERRVGESGLADAVDALGGRLDLGLLVHDAGFQHGSRPEQHEGVRSCASGRIDHGDSRHVNNRHLSIARRDDVVST